MLEFYFSDIFLFVDFEDRNLIYASLYLDAQHSSLKINQHIFTELIVSIIFLKFVLKINQINQDSFFNLKNSYSCPNLPNSISERHPC